VLEATVDRQLLLRALRLARLLGRVLRLSPELAPDRFRTAFTPRHLITHQVDVSGQAWAKRAAMAAHRSQASGSSIERTLALFLRLPRPVFRLVFGREWFVERGRAVAGRPVGDIFSALSRSQPVGRR
jgi:LmbE family N-acetylglucosaminyl deacetylase